MITVIIIIIELNEQLLISNNFAGVVEYDQLESLLIGVEVLWVKFFTGCMVLLLNLERETKHQDLDKLVLEQYLGSVVYVNLFLLLYHRGCITFVTLLIIN